MKFAVIGLGFECVLATGESQTEAMVAYNDKAMDLGEPKLDPNQFKTKVIGGVIDDSYVYVIPCTEELYANYSKQDVTFFALKDGEVKYLGE